MPKIFGAHKIFLKSFLSDDREDLWPDTDRDNPVVKQVDLSTHVVIRPHAKNARTWRSDKPLR
jgi:hypothetical protein